MAKNSFLKTRMYCFLRLDCWICSGDDGWHELAGYRNEINWAELNYPQKQLTPFTSQQKGLLSKSNTYGSLKMHLSQVHSKSALGLTLTLSDHARLGTLLAWLLRLLGSLGSELSALSDWLELLLFLVNKLNLTTIKTLTNLLSLLLKLIVAWITLDL